MRLVFAGLSCAVLLLSACETVPAQPMAAPAATMPATPPPAATLTTPPPAAATPPRQPQRQPTPQPTTPPPADLEILEGGGGDASW